MNIKIYGTGCPKCKALKANAEAALQAAHVEGTIEKIQDMNAIVAAGVMSTPALEIDGKIVSTGKVLSPKEIAALLGPGGGTAAAPAPAAGTSCSCGGACSCGVTGKKILTALLLVVVFAGVAAVAVREAKGRGCAGGVCPVPPVPATVSAAVPAAKDVLTVYYFHGNQRCMTCNKIEQMARAAVAAKYADALKAGTVVFRSVNVDEPGNGHFVNDFQLTSRIVVVERNGKHENLDQVWALVPGDPAKFAAYIQDGAARMMSAAK